LLAGPGVQCAMAAAFVAGNAVSSHHTHHYCYYYCAVVE